MSTLSAHILGLFLLSSVVDAFLSGAPLSTCWTRYPKHKGQGTQTTQSPIVITFSTPTYRPGAEITVTIEDPSPQKRWFSGIQMGAFRDSGNQEEIVGQFVSYNADKLKAVTCFGGYKNMITHKNGLKVQKLELTWKSPNENVGNVTFKATIVANFETFWTGVEAKLHSAIQDAATIKAPRHQAIISKRLVQDVDLSGCGDTKGCFLYPNHCGEDDCLAAVTFQYQSNTDDYLFEMYSTVALHYISLGFSDDAIMARDETVSCVSNSGLVSVQHGWNPGHSNERMITRFLSQAEIKQADGQLQCRFVLPRESSVYIINQDSNVLNYTNITFNRDTDWHLMLAWGNAMPASDVMSKHIEMPPVTFGKVSLKDTSIYRGSSFPVLVRVHGALMMIAWIFLGGIVTVVSRHFREWMPRVRLFGTKVWFQVHRELAILIAVLTAIGIIVIFYQYGAEIRTFSVPHSYVGLAVVTAVGVQVIAGFLRPGPDHKIRFLFNWGHRFLGQTAHILAAVTMFLAYDIAYFTKDMKIFGTAVLSVWVAVQLLWHIGFEILTCRVLLHGSKTWRPTAESSTRLSVFGNSQGMPLSSSQDNTESDKDKGSDACSLHTILFAIYVVVLSGLCTAAMLAFLLF